MRMPAARTLPGLLDEMAERYGERNFVTDQRRRLSYAEFRAEARRLAKGFWKLGVRRGDKVALLMGNQAEWLLVDFAVTMLGGWLVAVNTWWRARELHHALESSDSSVLVMVDRYLSNDYTAALAELGDLTTSLPLLRHVVALGEHGAPGALPFASLYAIGADVPDAVIDDAKRAVLPEDTAYLLFTSGSTARAKPVRLVHRGIIENPHGIGERQHLTERDRMLLPTSVFCALSCVNGLFAAMTHGASVVMLFRYDPGEMLRAIEEERCTSVYALPNVVLDIYAHPDRHTRDLSSWRTGTCRPNMMARVAEMGAREMVGGYGLTEGYGHSAENDGLDPLEKKIRNTGHPLPNTEIEVVDPATRRPLPRGTPGEIRMRGYVTPGYYKLPERTAEVLDAEGWFYTGDLGVIETDDGSLTFLSRIKEMIKTGGINVAPPDVEEVLHAHPTVQQAIVVGVPDPDREEIVAALVVPRPGCAIDRDVLLAHCRAQAAIYKVPRFIKVVGPAEVPLTDTGKVHREQTKRMLAAEYAATLAAK